MQYRQLPPAGDRSTVEAIWQAVPRDPADTDDCCARICDRTPVDTREAASQWLVFLTALGCVTSDGDGYYRNVDDLDVEQLGDQFESRVFAVSKVLDVLETADKPLASDEIRGRLDTGIRQRLQRAGESYLDRLLAWAVVFNRVEVIDGEYTVQWLD